MSCARLAGPVSALLCLISSACVQTTGGELVTYSLAARGPSTAVKGQPYRFVTPAGFDVALDRATLFVGAVYFNQTNPAGWSQETACTLPGIYTGEVRGSLKVDALDPSPQPFATQGNGTSSPTRAAELWLTAVDVSASDEHTVVLDVAGTATRGAESWPFDASFTIGQNRRAAPRSPALPGSNPICQRRIVTPIPTELTLSEGGTATLVVDPAAWFSTVDFSRLTVSPDNAARFRFIDDSSTGQQPDIALFNGLTSAQGPYRFEWEGRR